MRKLKIMMVTMGMGIGGAETHILELSRFLAQRGNTVIVCSSGGEYVAALEEAGIAHLEMPMNVRGPKEILSSFFALYKAVRKERPDIVHAHARIPALVADMVCRLLRIPLVTSVHGKFLVTPLLRLMSRWGKHSLTVSDDLRDYLKDNYRIPDSQITVSVNGINVDLFSPADDCPELREELSIPADKKVVLMVTRMDDDTGAFHLIDCASALYKARPDTMMVLVGSGSRYQEVCTRADEVNRELGTRYILPVGSRTDVARFCQMCSVFVGIARSALEALACKKPVILAGKDHYLGLFQEDKLQDCLRTNFTCRGFDFPGKNVLSAQLLEAIEQAGNMEQTLEIGRQLVIHDYSIVRMTSDALLAYRQVLTRKRWDILLCGYYGYDNIGDEYALRAIIQNLRANKPDIRICVLTNCPAKVAPQLGVTCADRFSIHAVLKTIRLSHMMIFGGGNLLQDASSSKSLWYYLMLLRWAKFKKLPTMIYANGIGPIRRRFNLHLTGRVLRGLDSITLREKDSYTLVRSLGIPAEKLKITADEAFSSQLSPSSSDILSREHLDAGGYLLLSVRKSQSCAPDFFKILAAALDEISASHHLVTVFMQMQEPNDLAPSEEVAHWMTSPSRILSSLNFDDVSCLLSGARLVVGMRLHALILGAIASSPIYGLVYDDKVKSFLMNAGIDRFAFCSSPDKDQIVRDLHDILDEEHDIRTATASFTALQRERALENAKEAIALLNKSNRKRWE